MICSQRTCGVDSRLLSLFAVFLANFLICSADYTLRTKSITVKISTIMTPAFARKISGGKENSDYAGFIPELLKELANRRGITEHYLIVPTTDNIIGHKHAYNNLTGLLHDVLSESDKERVIGAGPILDSNTAIKGKVQLSQTWANVDLTLVVKNTSNVTNLREVLDKQMVVLAVKDSQELAEVQERGTGDIAELDTRIKKFSRFVDTAERGLQLVANELNYALLMSREEARYYVTHDFCNLKPLSGFHRLGGYVFVLYPNSLQVNNLNSALDAMSRDGSLDKLRNRELGIIGTCSKGSIGHLEKLFAFLLVTATVSVARILS